MSSKLILILGILVLQRLLIGLCHSSDANQIFYVATNGSDANPGTISAPFATLNRARDAIRNIKKTNNNALPPGDIIVYIRGGKYMNKNYSEYNQPLLTLSGSTESPDLRVPRSV